MKIKAKKPRAYHTAPTSFELLCFNESKSTQIVRLYSVF